MIQHGGKELSFINLLDFESAWTPRPFLRVSPPV